MAYETTIADYETVIGALPENTADTPYDVVIINSTLSTYSNFKYSITRAGRYVKIKWGENTICSSTELFQQYLMSPFLVGIDTSIFINVTKAIGLFYDCHSLKEVDTSGLVNVTNARMMFYRCSLLNEIDTSNLGNVTDAMGMFGECNFSYIDVSGLTNVTNAEGMFSYCPNLILVRYIPGQTSPAVIAQIPEGKGVFDKCVTTIENYESVIGALPENDSDTPYDVYIKDIENIVLNNSNPSNLGSAMLNARRHVNVKWTENALYKDTSTNYMFSDCHFLESIDTSPFVNVTNSNHMFSGCLNLKYIDNSNFRNVTNAIGMFSSCNFRNIDISFFTKLIDATGMFYSCNLLTSINTSMLKNLTTANRMFGKCNSLASINTSGLTNITYASELFLDCSSLTSIDTSCFTNVTDASDMFSGCTNLQEVDTSPFTNVTNANAMFNGCSSLTSVDTSPFTNVTIISAMFENCSALTHADTYSFSNATNANRLFDGCTSLRTINLVNLPLVSGRSSVSMLTDVNAKIFYIRETLSDWVLSKLNAYSDEKVEGILLSCSDYKNMVSSLPDNDSSTPYNIYISDPENIASIGIEEGD